MEKNVNKKIEKRIRKRLRVGFVIIVVLFTALSARLAYLSLVKNDESVEKLQEQKKKQYSSTDIKAQRGYIYDRNGTILASSEKIYNILIEPINIYSKSENNISRDDADEIQKETLDALKEYFGISPDFLLAEMKKQPNSYYYVIEKEGLKDSDTNRLVEVSYDKVKEFQNDKTYTTAEKEDKNTTAAEKKAEKEKAEKLSKVRGISFIDNYKRDYPNGELACHVIGFYGSENSMQGLESSYNDVLSGENGRSYTIRTEDNREVRKIEPAVDGDSIVTTIDSEIQRIVQTKCEEFEKQQMQANNISVLVMNPQNGEVLALYNSHQYDPNNPYELSKTKFYYEQKNETADSKKSYKSFEISDEEYASVTDASPSDAASKKELETYKNNALAALWSDSAVKSTYEPGSTYKTFTVAGALDKGVTTPDEKFLCDGGQQIGDFYIRCHQHSGHGLITVAQGIEYSCNDVLMQIAAKEGRTTFAEYQSLFGFGHKTNIDLPDEPSETELSNQVYDDKNKKLNEVELATSSFGQGVNVTMIQLGAAFCSAINGGFYYQPHVVKQVLDSEGNLVKNYDKILVRRPISTNTSIELRSMLKDVITGGTGKKAAVPGYSIGGKSGTAEKQPRGTNKYVLSFIGFSPVDDPQVVLYCVVDEPHVDDPSSSAAGTLLFNKIATELLPYMNIDKTGNDAEVEANTTGDEIATSVFDGASPGST